MPAPLALQLYTVRNALRHDFEGTVRRAAELGYAGVEPFHGMGVRPERAGSLFSRLNLAVPAAHMPTRNGELCEETLDAAAALGCSRIVSGFGPEEFSTLDGIYRCCDDFNHASEMTRAAGLEFCVHNHWWEFTPVAGEYPYRILLERLDPDVLFELDIYWVATAGLDPLDVLAELGERTPLLHVKDGPAVHNRPMTAVGQGTLDIPGIIKANRANTEWLIVELDECETSVMQAIADSRDYLVEHGLAAGALQQRPPNRRPEP
jgi:sugar phosphate isomerase/epimerase